MRTDASVSQPEGAAGAGAWPWGRPTCTMVWAGAATGGAALASASSASLAESWALTASKSSCATSPPPQAATMPTAESTNTIRIVLVQR